MLFINTCVVVLIMAFALACNSLQTLKGVVLRNKQKNSQDLDLIFDLNEGDPDNGATFHLLNITEDNIVIIPEPKQYIEINIETFGQDLPNEKADGWLDVWLTLTVDDDIYLDTPGQIRVQGSSTARWPKKTGHFHFILIKNAVKKSKFK